MLALKPPVRARAGGEIDPDRLTVPPPPGTGHLSRGDLHTHEIILGIDVQMAAERNTTSTAVDEIAARVSGLQTAVVLRNDAAGAYPASASRATHYCDPAGFSCV
jgi:hypothetical protein